MRNVDTELDIRGVKKLVVETKVVIREEVKVTKLTKKPISDKAYATKVDNGWTWRDLRAYVEGEREVRGMGKFVEPEQRHRAILENFLNRWGESAPKIARYAFEHCDGEWAGQQIGLSKFTKGSDPYFAVPISQKLGASSVEAW